MISAAAAATPTTHKAKLAFYLWRFRFMIQAAHTQAMHAPFDACVYLCAPTSPIHLCFTFATLACEPILSLSLCLRFSIAFGIESFVLRIS